jgi:hypothetical protein
MDKVEFTFKRGGRTKPVTAYQAKVLSRAGLGTYQTRDMIANRQIGQQIQNTMMISDTELPPISDEYSAMDKDQLHELAKERGIKIHHLAGADKVRSALREASE